VLTLDSLDFFGTLYITNSLKWRTTYQATVCLGHKLQDSSIESHYWCLFKAVSVCTASNQISICTSGSRQTSTPNIQDGKIGWSKGSTTEPPIWKRSIQNGTTLYLTWCGAPPHRPDGVQPFIDLWYRELLLPVQVTDVKKKRDPQNFILFISVHRFHYIKWTPTNAPIYD